MVTSLIVLAHPERRSFNAAWAQATKEACAALGHTVLWSDLVAMGFDPVEGPEHYGSADTGERFDPLKAQKQAVARDAVPHDVAAEIDKVLMADRVIFHFPMWWFAPPAILKGWFDRVLMRGALHSSTQQFDNGICRGKTALFCVTTGATSAECALNGREGDAAMLLWPAAQTLRYVGFDLLSPKIVSGVHGFHDGSARAELDARLTQVLAEQAALIADWDARPRMAFNADDDFDSDGRLLPDRPSHSFFIRHHPQTLNRIPNGKRPAG